LAITFHNNDAGAVHNFALYTDQNATEVIFQGDSITGPGTVMYRFQAPGPGTYFFRCDNQLAMNGTFVVQ